MHQRSYLKQKLRGAMLLTMLSTSLILFFLFSIASFNENDFMYGAAPAVWSQHGSLYSDVPFVQAPLSLLFYVLLVKITGSVNIYLIARITSVVLVLAAVLLPTITNQNNRDPLLWIPYVALCLTNLFINSNSNEIGNYAIALFCLSISIESIYLRGSVLWRAFLSCAAIGFATSAKLYFILMCPAIFLAFLLSDKAARKPNVVLACAAGFLFGFSPILYFLAKNYHSFLKWNIFIMFSFLRVREIDGLVSASLWQLLPVFASLMFVPIILMGAMLVQQYRRCGLTGNSAGKIILVFCAFLMALSPGMVFLQYLGPVALLLFRFSLPWRSNSSSRPVYVISSAILFCVQCIFVAILIFIHIARSDGLEALQVIKLQRRAADIVGDNYKCERKFYSAEPSFLLGNGVKYPRELASGPFLLFLGRRTNVSKFGAEFEVNAGIAQWNPDVVIWGYFLGRRRPEEDEVDQAVRNYAIAHKFRVQQIGYINRRAVYLGFKSSCKN